jgi:spoIIIJ-associated protein
LIFGATACIRRVASELDVPESCLQAKIVSEGRSFLGFFGKKLQIEITVNPIPVESAGSIKKESKPNTDQESSVNSDNNEEAKLKLINDSKIFLDELMNKMCLNVSSQVTDNYISLDGEDATIVVGRYGDTLKAIEYLLNLCLRETKDVPRVRLDSNGYRERRATNLQRIAASAAKKAADRGIPIRLEPMASWERRIVHIALQDSQDVVTESIGESPERKVVIMPKVNHNEVRTRARRRMRR